MCDANQYEDLKFTLRKCKFVTGPGALKLYNPVTGVGENENPILRPNPITTNSQEIKISFSGITTSHSRDFPIGSQVETAKQEFIQVRNPNLINSAID